MWDKICKWICKDFELLENAGIGVVAFGCAWMFVSDKSCMTQKLLISVCVILFCAVICTMFRLYLQKKAKAEGFEFVARKAPSYAKSKRYIIMYFGMFAVFVILHAVSNAVPWWLCAQIYIIPIVLACCACLLIEKHNYKQKAKQK